MSEKLFWIGIGASAGGLEALKEFVGNLKGKNTVYVIAQHLDPKHPTILKDLLERVSELPIHMVDSDTYPTEGAIYIISPGHNANVKDGMIVLTPAAPIGPKPSINEFFTSLAADIGEHAIGVILSGTGSDGAQGVISIKASGGITYVQDQQSAKYSGMPHAAIETGIIDFILTPQEIAFEIESFVQSSSQSSETRFSGPKVRNNLEKIFQRLYDLTNYDFSGYKIKTIQRRIQRRMVVNKVITLDDYVTLLMSSGSEVENLFKELLISVTSFFRDTEAFEDLKDIIETLVKRTQPGHTVRIWVAGCAKGEEAYSIAILFQETIYRLNKEVLYQIFATDIDDNALNMARQATYSAEQLKDIPEDLIERYFNCYEELYVVKKELRDQIVFAKQNLIMDPPFSHLDLISCRNVLIYFNTETQKKVFQTFHFALKPDGYLFLGKSESATNTVPELFEIYKTSSQIFTRRMTEVHRKGDLIASAKVIASHQTPQPRSPKLPHPEHSMPIEKHLERSLLEHMIPAAIVINSQGQMLHVRGDMNRFLHIPEGRIDNNILTMSREDLKIDIRSLIQRSRREGNASAQALFYTHEQENHSLYLMMRKLEVPENDDLFSLAFFDLNLHEGSFPKLLHTSISDLSNDQLKNEVEIFRERLQSSIQDLETTNEELQSTNEELQSANEELQSANEELQTANEELQSTNEELSTVNEELEVKTFELALVNNDLESMLYNIDELILFVDTRLRLHRYTEKAANEFHLTRDDIGQIVSSFDLAMDIPNFRVELLNIVEQELESTIQVRSQRMNYNLRMVPYKADDTEVVGVILFFEHTDKRNSVNNSMRIHMLRFLEAHTNHPLICIAEDGTLTYLSEPFATHLGYPHSNALQGELIHSLCAKTYNGYESPSFDTEGEWKSIALNCKNGDKIVAKYKSVPCPDERFSEKIIFIDFQDSVTCPIRPMRCTPLNKNATLIKSRCINSIP